VRYYENCRWAYKPDFDNFYHCDKRGMLIHPDVIPVYQVCRFCPYWEAKDEILH
jgi:hypothetical protein